MDNLKNLTGPERRKLLDSVFGLDRIMLLLLFETGFEVEELISLRVSDADLDSGDIRTASGKRLRISHQSLSELKSYLKARPSQAYLFEGRCGKPITVKWKRCVLEKLLQRVKEEGVGEKVRGGE